jgi:hypothetical protein
MRESFKKLFKLNPNLKALLAIFVVLLALGLTVFLSQRQQETRQQAAGSGSDYYVATTGNDSNPGTKIAPFATINKAAFVALAGTTIHVAAGTYTQPVITNNSGLATGRITYVSDVKWGAKIVADGAVTNSNVSLQNNDSTWQNKGDYVDIIGFDISGGKRIGILNRASHVRISENKVHDVAPGYCENLGGAGIDSAYSPSQQDNDYSRNFVLNVGPRTCPGQTTNSYVHGIYIQSLNEKVTNNILVNNGGIGIACTHGCNGPIISNNLILNNGYGIRVGWSQATPSGKTNNAIVSNNIIMNNIKYAIYEYTTGLGTNNQFLNNVLTGNIPNTCSANDCIGNLLTNPLFVNYQLDGSGDYHLKTFSPVIDAGTSMGAPSTDFENNPRPQGKGFDIGPYEYVVATPPPTRTPEGTRLRCRPRPACLDANPPCKIPEDEDWCQPSQSPLPTVCPQVITPARNPYSRQCLNFPNPCAVPKGWTVVGRCYPD